MLLEVNNINVYYGAIHAIKDVSFSVGEGEIVTLIGANGAGKTTTLNTVSGLLRSKTGSITFEGKSIAHTAPDIIVRQGIAHVPEGRRIFQEMSVQENLEMGAFTRSNSEIAPGLEKVYELFPRLAERRRQVAGTLSGGEQQMLAMGSRPWAWRPFWSSRCSRSSDSCTRPERPSSSWSRTPRWRWPWPTGPTFWRRAA